MEFEEWVIKAKPEMDECRNVAQKRIMAGENMYANYLEELLDISGVALRLLEEAEAYHLEAVNIMLNELTPEEKSGNKKTLIDAMKKMPCGQLTILNSMAKLNDTISLRVTIAQSLIKFYCK
jgi:hypothetical protein